MNLAQNWSIESLPDDVDIVIHFAQSEHYKEFPDQAVDVFNVNIASTFQLLEYSRKVKASTFVYASSGGVYGASNTTCSENDRIQDVANLDFYLGSKLCSEVLVRNYSNFFNIIILRFFFVYGPGQRETMLIPRLVASIRQGIPITLQNKTGLILNPIYVDDAAMAAYHALSLQGNHIINVAGPECISIKEIAEIIGAVINKKPLFQIGDSNKQLQLVGSITRMSKLLNSPHIRFREGIEKYISYSK